MPGRELLQVVPLAIFRSDNIPEMYSKEPTRSFVVDEACALGEEFSIFPLSSRYRRDGIRFTEVDELNAATMGSVDIGWIGHVQVAGPKLYAEVADEVKVTSIAAYCPDNSPAHNNVEASLVKHLLAGKYASERVDGKSHKRRLPEGIVYEKDLRLLPHCGDPVPEGLTVAYNFRAEGSRIIFSI